jgi:hypothetical protein
MFISLSGKIPIYEPEFLSKPATGTICCEGGTEAEFATTGTWFILGIEQDVSSCAPLGLLWAIYE